MSEDMTIIGLGEFKCQICGSPLMADSLNLLFHPPSAAATQCKFAGKRFSPPTFEVSEYVGRSANQ